ncbi:hypothetical protein Tco_0725989 [Tanacetum coccineum]|uniref:Uncharacterized protein n=1 Tax=Tanacetum coccineum TaxID=301880 RepID=A0ABQ4YEE6_9ASTR
MNMTPENRTHFKSEKEVIHLILTGIGDKIYLTVDACQTAQEIWEAIERLQQDTDEEINEQRVEAIKVYMDSPGRLYANSDTDAEPLETVETGDSNVLPDSPDMYDNDIQDDQNDVECDDERVALANLIANLKLDVDENKKI